MLVKAWAIPLICLDYQIRQDYIAKTLCVNRNRPKLNCNGKCYLAKKLAAAEKQQERQAEQDLMASLIYQVMSSESNFALEYAAPSFQAIDAVKYHFQSSFKDRLMIGSIFHPPLA